MVGSQMFWNIAEFWMALLDGAALTVVLLPNTQNHVVPEWPICSGLLGPTHLDCSRDAGGAFLVGRLGSGGRSS